MDWSNCYSEKRTGVSNSPEIPRTEYQRDYDRLIFASSFRRLQNKTQVFPLPGSTFVHNRLTHSLEVASVGRSMGKIVGDYIAETDLGKYEQEVSAFYRTDLSSVIASACLAHDIGNPSFGHSGEKAISNYFKSQQDEKIEGIALKDYFSEREWNDLVNFEGNANAFRILTHHYHDKPKGGMRLTYATLASIIKYPCHSGAVDHELRHRKKYGYFIAEEQNFLSLAKGVQMIEEPNLPGCYKRHPFVYLVEAADDICYRIIDMEDAHRLSIVSKSVLSELLLGVIEELNRAQDDISKIKKTFRSIRDDNDSIAYLRAKTINALTLECSEIFIENRQQLLAGSFNSSLLEISESKSQTLKAIVDYSVKHIYNHHSVVEIEITGFHVMSHLLNLFVPAVLRSRKIGTDEMALKLIPLQFREYETSSNNYIKSLSVVDFIAGMTDAYATEFYRKTSGIDISKHN